MAQKRAFSNNKNVQKRDRGCYSPCGQIKASHRILLVKKYEETGSFSAAAREAGCHENTAKRWIQRYEETGDVDRSPYKERQSIVMTPELITRAITLIDEGTGDLPCGIPSWSNLVSTLQSEGFYCSRRSITRTLKREGIILRTVPRRPALTAAHKQKRVELCRELSEWTPRDLESIIWTRLLFPNFLKRHSGAVVVMDNCPIHNTARCHFDENSVTMLAWPPMSPDLNPIENIWGQIESLKNTKYPKNRGELCDAIHSGIELLKREQHGVFVSTLQSMPRRKWGGHCGY